MRQTPNSAKCNRADPCVDCSRVLTCFERESDEALWKKIDEHAAAREAKGLASGDGQMEDNAPSAEEKAPSTEARSVGASPVRAGWDNPRDCKQPPAEHFTSTLDVVNPRDERQAAECDYEWEGGDVAATLSQSAVNEAMQLAQRQKQTKRLAECDQPRERKEDEAAAGAWAGALEPAAAPAPAAAAAAAPAPAPARAPALAAKLWRQLGGRLGRRL